MTTLQQIAEAIKVNGKIPAKKKNFAIRYLGKFKGIIPSNKSSTVFLQELRTNLYGKIR